MKRTFFAVLLFVTPFLLIQNGCAHYPLIREPEWDIIKQIELSSTLQDSLDAGKLTAGMPWLIVDQLFRDWTASLQDTQIPVASIGSKQRLVEEEGLSRKYIDPDTPIFLDKYETYRGEVNVWYQRPDFYKMEVTSRDTLCILWRDTLRCSVIKYLNNSRVLTVRDTLSSAPPDTSLSAEIRYHDHPWRTTSYWYNLVKLGNGVSFKIGPLNYEIYPIEFMELNNEPVSSIPWREVNKDEN